MLATDRQRSVCNVLDATQNKPIVYTAYGHRSSENGVLSLLGFNGERPDPLTGHYHLGNGYRQFNPVLMRFNSPDNLSPFEKGGLNPYVYCVGDPVNRSDPTGHFSGLLLAGIIGLVVGTASAAAAEIVEDDTLAYALDGLAVVSASFAAFAFGGYAFKGRGLKGRGLRGSRGAPARAQTGDFEMRSLTSNANPARQPASPPRSSPSSSPNQGSFSRPQTSGSVSPKIEFGRRDNILRIPRVRSPQNPEITNIRTS
ncbi:RHS repeat-associated core domain-containing protein [Pseudomonas sp. Sample_24]|uniref:RHS repeat-associated core domain-containing protein n=1 Tax=Pseudomonas sp. Sample_24 TaxID=2448268 RepID=UPI001F4F626C|nr:RHS repeat-associated core domain-containing protein [Pseudomonas sp. Sample_24]